MLVLLVNGAKTGRPSVNAYLELKLSAYSRQTFSNVSQDQDMHFLFICGGHIYSIGGHRT